MGTSSAPFTHSGSLIGKQVLDITVVAGTDEAFRIQQLMSEIYWKEFAPAIEHLAEVIPGEELVRIDKLEVDLGEVNERDLETGYVKELLESKLALELTGLIAAPDFRTIRESKSAAAFRKWLFYMEHGYLPWDAVPDSDDWGTEVLPALKANEGLVERLRELIRNREVRRRIVQQYPESFVFALVRLFHPLEWGELNKVMVAFSEVSEEAGGGDGGASRLLRSMFWMELIKQAAERDQVSAACAFVEVIKGQFSPGRAADIIHSGLRKHFKGNQRLLENRNQPSVAKPEEDFSDVPNYEPEGESFVQHAGLVLLHPFFNPLFTNLQLVQQGRFVDLAAQLKALFVLHFLATGRQEAAEYKLVIPKVICGYPLPQAVPRQLQLEKDEMKECLEVLGAVILQWDILKGTSVAGLREGFLQRSGKLYRSEGKIRLSVENQGIDVLLQYLPWNLSIVQLPWLKDLILVEW